MRRYQKKSVVKFNSPKTSKHQNNANEQLSNFVSKSKSNQQKDPNQNNPELLENYLNGVYGALSNNKNIIEN
jgi:hypothetical protein